MSVVPMEAPEEEPVTAEAPGQDEKPEKTEEFTSPFLRSRNKPDDAETEKETLQEDDEEEEEDEEEDEEEEEAFIPKGKLVFMTLDKDNRKAENVKLQGIPGEHFDKHPIAFLDGKVIYPYQQLPGPVTGFWNIVVAAPSGKGKTTYLRDLALLNLQLNPDRHIVFISSKQDTSSLLNAKYARDPDCVDGQLDPDPEKITILRTNEPGNVEKIGRFRKELAANIKSVYQNAIILIDDLEDSDEAYEDMCHIRNVFIKTGRQYGISVAHSCHLTSGYENSHMRNEAQAFVVNFEHGNFVPAAANFLYNKLQLNRSQMSKLRIMIKESVKGHDPPIGTGWVIICIPYNIVIAGSRIISLSHLMDDDEPKNKKAKLEEEEEEEEDNAEEEEEEPMDDPVESDKGKPEENKQILRGRKIPPHERFANKSPPKRKGNDVWVCPDCQELCRGTGGYNLHRRRRHKESGVPTEGSAKRIVLE